jgi:hypothetical protein
LPNLQKTAFDPRRMFIAVVAQPLGDLRICVACHAT